MIHILARCEGEKVLVTIRDCAAIGFNAECVGAAPADLADHKLFDMVVPLYFFQNHGKSNVDKRLGNIEDKWEKSNIFGPDSMLLPLETVSPHASLLE